MYLHGSVEHMRGPCIYMVVLSLWEDCLQCIYMVVLSLWGDHYLHGSVEHMRGPCIYMVVLSLWEDCLQCIYMVVLSLWEDCLPLIATPFLSTDKRALLSSCSLAVFALISTSSKLTGAPAYLVNMYINHHIPYDIHLIIVLQTSVSTSVLKQLTGTFCNYC